MKRAAHFPTTLRPYDPTTLRPYDPTSSLSIIKGLDYTDLGDSGPYGDRRLKLCLLHGGRIRISSKDTIYQDPEKRISKLRKDLYLLGIVDSTAFPDLDGLARELSALY